MIVQIRTSTREAVEAVSIFASKLDESVPRPMSQFLT